MENSGLLRPKSAKSATQGPPGASDPWCSSLPEFLGLQNRGDHSGQQALNGDLSLPFVSPFFLFFGGGGQILSHNFFVTPPNAQGDHLFVLFFVGSCCFVLFSEDESSGLPPLRLRGVAQRLCALQLLLQPLGPSEPENKNTRFFGAFCQGLLGL